MSLSSAIRISGLSKAYHINRVGGDPATTLGEAVVGGIRSCLRRPEKDTFWALNDINLDVNQGEVVGVIGHNGAGKSTLLKVLSRITEPTKGRIELYGRVGSLLEVGTGFHPELSGRENIFLNGSVLGMRNPEIKKQFDAIVDFAGVAKFLDTPVKRYSSGMYVRLAFAVAAHLNPEILIIDEVLAVGDVEFQQKCLGKMGQVAKSGRTVLFVSHNMGAIRSLCDKVVVMSAGRVQAFMNTPDAIGLYLGRNEDAAAQWTNAKLSEGETGICSVSITQGGELCDCIQIEKPFRVNIETQGSMPDDVQFGIQIRSAEGEVVCHLSDEFENSEGKPNSTRRCELPKYVFRPGKYHVSIWMFVRNQEIIDHVEDCVDFNVVWSGPLSEKTCESDWNGVMGPGIGVWE